MREITLDTYKSFYCADDKNEVYELANGAANSGRFQYLKSSSLINQTQNIFENVNVVDILGSDKAVTKLRETAYSAVVMTHFLIKEKHSDSNMFMRVIYKIVDYLWSVDSRFEKFVSEYKECFVPGDHLDLQIMETLELNEHASASEAMFQNKKANMLMTECSNRTREVLEKADTFKVITDPSLKFALVSELDRRSQMEKDGLVTSICKMATGEGMKDSFEVSSFLREGLLEALKKQAKSEGATLDLKKKYAPQVLDQVIYTTSVSAL